MVRNKAELISVSNQWIATAKEEIRKHAAAFMQRTGASLEDFASILDIDVNMANAILNGHADIPLSVFAKILVGTGHIIVITPEAQMPRMGAVPQRRGSRRVPQQPARDAQGRFTRRGMPMPPMNGGYPMPQGMPMPMGAPYGGYPIPNPNGQMPSPEEVFENAMPQGFDMQPTPQMPMPMEPVEEETAVDAVAPEANDDELTALAHALLQNPEIANLLKGLLNAE